MYLPDDFDNFLFSPLFINLIIATTAAAAATTGIIIESTFYLLIHILRNI
ncbi:hypothetical protein ECH_0112 [Ehrlichia chaffeensis str. Arkansas]|uniref:Uncharacterized protein n=1 Tax=Ehrlichia chaffeensis (strain ATCC CRL-10679 / Arkansas) TaxID=205920 RepID=Q2GHZ3_EHRCR|nr:hypothetical protein ECH_0112 [Ehrlichia chaffeensis str. Arkansas]